MRIDNADERLTPIGRKMGLVNEERWAGFLGKQEQKRLIVELLEKTRTSALPDVIGLDATTDNPSLGVWLRRPEAKIGLLEPWLAGKLGGRLAHGVLTTVETESNTKGICSSRTGRFGGGGF